MKRGLAYSVFAINHSHTDAGSFWVQGGFNAEKVDDAVAAIVEQLRQVTDEPVSQEELDKARNYAKSRFVLAGDASGDHQSRLEGRGSRGTPARAVGRPHGTRSRHARRPAARCT